MARSLSVKVATTKVIKSLEDKIASNAKVAKSNQAKREKHKADLAKYQKSIMKDFAGQLEIDSIDTRWNGQLEVNYKLAKGVELPPKPELDVEQELGNWEIQEIENAIRILKMTDEEVVNATTFKTIAQYL